MEKKEFCPSFCQSCGMPMGETDEMYGTNADETKSEDYCNLCYAEGSFTEDMSQDEMIEFCVSHVVAANPDMTEDEARNMMKELYPSLKRWKEC